MDLPENQGYNLPDDHEYNFEVMPRPKLEKKGYKLMHDPKKGYWVAGAEGRRVADYYPDEFSACRNSLIRVLLEQDDIYRGRPPRWLIKPPRPEV